MEIPFEKADNNQLLHYAQAVLGLDVGRGTNNARLVELIRQVNPDATGIPLGGDDPREQVEEIKGGVTARDYSNDPTIEVFINASAEKGGDRAVPVSVNGDLVLIKRNTWVKIPYRFYEALQNAIQTSFEPELDNIGKMVGKREVHSLAFPHNSRNGPSQAEIDAWVKRSSKPKKLAA